MNSRNRFTATPDAPGDVAHGGRKMLWVSRGVYDRVWVLAHAQQQTMREAADALFASRMGRLRAQILDMLNPEWRRRQPVRRGEDERALRRAAAILRERGHGLLGDVVEAAANVC